MAANVYVKDGGTWRVPENVYVNDAGTWRPIKNIYVNDAGTWRVVFTQAVVNFFPDNGNCVDSAGSTHTNTFTVNNTGQLSADCDNPGACSSGVGGHCFSQNWVTPTSAAGANYECRVTVNSGAFSTGTTGTWLSLATTRTWTVSRSTAGATGCNFTLEIRRAFDGVVLKSATFSIQVDLS